MLAAYLDTSALVKLYVRETASEPVAALYDRLDVAACHEIGYVELRAALAAAQRLGRIEAEIHDALVRDFRADWGAGVSKVGNDATLLERAAELAEGFALRGYDALHLAAAERVRTALPDTQFVSFDRALNRAARLLGFALALPEQP